MRTIYRPLGLADISPHSDKEKLTLSPFSQRHRAQHVRICWNALFNERICAEKNVDFNTHDIALLSVKFHEKLKSFFLHVKQYHLAQNDRFIANINFKLVKFASLDSVL